MNSLFDLVFICFFIHLLLTGPYGHTSTSSFTLTMANGGFGCTNQMRTWIFLCSGLHLMRLWQKRNAKWRGFIWSPVRRGSNNEHGGMLLILGRFGPNNEEGPRFGGFGIYGLCLYGLCCFFSITSDSVLKAQEMAFWNMAVKPY